MLKIGDFSKLSRVSIRMLRHYDEIGLLHPVQIDRESGYRYYSENQLPVAGRITALKDMGFGLADIGEMLDCYEEKAVMERHLRLKRTELLEQSQQTAYRLRLLDTALERLRKDETMQYDVTLKTFPERYA
ncbi:MAG: helix-turn-helix domain-containing protein, partial [Faecousia sp.]